MFCHDVVTPEVVRRCWPAISELDLYKFWYSKVLLLWKIGSWPSLVVGLGLLKQKKYNTLEIAVHLFVEVLAALFMYNQDATDSAHIAVFGC